MTPSIPDYDAIRRSISPTHDAAMSGRKPQHSRYLYRARVLCLIFILLSFVVAFLTWFSQRLLSSSRKNLSNDVGFPIELPSLPSAVQFRPRAVSSIRHTFSHATVPQHEFFNYTQARLSVPMCGLMDRTEGLRCAAILHVELGPSGKVVYAGFMVHSTGIDVLPVGKDTTQRIRSLNISQATDYASRLVASVDTSLSARFACGVKAVPVAAAIVRAAPVVALCTHTADAHCYNDYVVATC